MKKIQIPDHAPFASLGLVGNDSIKVIVLIIFILGILWARTPNPPLNAFDQPFYLGIAHDILHEGKFTDGYVFDQSKGERPSGMRFAPLYPGLVAVVAVYDPAFARSIDCVVDSGGKDQSCPNTALPLRLLQFGLLAGFYFLLWYIARNLSGSRLTGGLALAIALIAAPQLVADATYAMTEIVCLFCTTAATVAMLAALKKLKQNGTCWCAALSGLMLGLAILTRPAFLYLGLAAIAVGLFYTLKNIFYPLPHGRGRDPLLQQREGEGVGSTNISTLTRPPLAVDLSHEGEVRRIVLQFSLALILTLTPWLARNAVVLHHFGLTRGYAAHTLVQRVAFDEMDWSQVPNSFLCWLPDGRSWLGSETCDIFGWDAPDSFYKFGNGAFMTGVLAQTGGWQQVIPHLLIHNILAEPIKYFAVTLSLASRGAWIANDWGLLCLELFIWRFIIALRRRDANFLLLALPGLFMLMFNAAVSVNQTRYNLMLILPYALSAALALRAITERIKARA